MIPQQHQRREEPLLTQIRVFDTPEDANEWLKKCWDEFVDLGVYRRILTTKMADGKVYIIYLMNRSDAD